MNKMNTVADTTKLFLKPAEILQKTSIWLVREHIT